MEIMKGELTYEHQLSKNKIFKSTYHENNGRRFNLIASII